MAKRLVLCLDGTQNSPEQDVGIVNGYKLYKPTNVLKTFRAISPVGLDPVGPSRVSQIAYYSEGVGSMIGESTGYGKFAVLVDRVIGGAEGSGYEARVKSAYRFLVANYEPNDKIFVFGFSRGAAEAQTLVRFIDWVGGAARDVGGILRKADEYWIPQLYDGFRQSQMKPYSHAAPGKVDKVYDDIRGQGGHFENPQEARIEFLGVWDTVVSVGSRLAPDGKVATVAEKYGYLVDRRPPSCVKVIRQALAIDERRWDFRPQIWRPDLKSPTDGVRPLVQLWFPGVHSNVGGGYQHDGLADEALKWIIGEATTITQLAVDEAYLEYFFKDKGPSYKPSRPDSNKPWARFADLVRGKRGRGVRKLATWDQNGSWELSCLGFHDQLWKLLLGDGTYRPSNLLEYLASNQKRIDELQEPRRGEVQKIVTDFAGVRG
jgi:uncharacterized protein (DUF2235 family)